MPLYFHYMSPFIPWKMLLLIDPACFFGIITNLLLCPVSCAVLHSMPCNNPILFLELSFQQILVHRQIILRIRFSIIRAIQNSPGRFSYI